MTPARAATRKPAMPRGAKPPSVDAYLAKVPPEQRAALQRLRRTIRAAAPEAEEVISYGMPGYKLDGYLVAFAAFNDHCSFFPGASIVKDYRAELKAYATSKGTVRFTPDHPLPASLVRRIVLDRIAANRARRAKRAEAKRRSR